MILDYIRKEILREQASFLVEIKDRYEDLYKNIKVFLKEKFPEDNNYTKQIIDIIDWWDYEQLNDVFEKIAEYMNDDLFDSWDDRAISNADLSIIAWMRIVYWWLDKLKDNPEIKDSTNMFEVSLNWKVFFVQTTKDKTLIEKTITDLYYTHASWWEWMMSVDEDSVMEDFSKMNIWKIINPIDKIDLHFII